MNDALKRLHKIIKTFINAKKVTTDVSARALLNIKATESEHPSGYVWAIVGCVGVTMLALKLRDTLAPANSILMYLMVVVLLAARFGRKPAVIASILAVLSFDFFLVSPYFSIRVADPQYLITFAAMLAVALIISHLTAHLRQQVQIALLRESRAASLFNLSKDLSAALTYEQIAAIVTQHIVAMLHTKISLLLPDKFGELSVFTVQGKHNIPSSNAFLSMAKKVYEEQLPIGFGNDSAQIYQHLYVPLRAPMRIRGVLVVVLNKSDQSALREPIRLLETCAAQIAIAIERIHYVNVAQSAVVAMESERLRNSLLSAISHDIRTPLTTIVGISTALASNSISKEIQREMMDALQEEALRMNSLVTNMLDMAKLHAGGIKLNKQWQMLEEVIGSALGMLSRSLADHSVEVHLPASLPLLEFDAVLLERVFCNLLDNAAKYTLPQQTIWIHAKCTDVDVLIAVEDDGPGISKGMEEAIFEKFTRGDPESALTGVGLGLSICRAIIEAHGGRIWAEKHTGSAGDARRGACFIFSLPLGAPPGSDFSLDQHAFIEESLIQ
ncbi:MAG: DUF4118 domain-containing protein [Pseudomonadota bacterium]